MEIKLNVEARENNIKSNYNRAIIEIVQNAEKGIEFTELVFPKDIFNEVRNKINDHMSSFCIKYVWVGIGDMNSIAVAGGRLMKFKLLN